MVTARVERCSAHGELWLTRTLARTLTRTLALALALTLTNQAAELRTYDPF